MCLLHHHHFLPSHHGHHYIATHPFTANHEGDYLHPLTCIGCPCQNTPFILYDSVDHHNTILPYEGCPAHDCCIAIYSVSYCQYFNAEIGFDRADDDPEREKLCPNFLRVHHYHPRGLLTREPGGERFPTPVLNVEEMFYTERPADDMMIYEFDEVEQSDVFDGLAFMRLNAMRDAGALWSAKETMKLEKRRAMAFMDELEVRWMMLGEYTDEDAAPEIGAMFVSLRSLEWCMTEIYKDFLSHIALVLSFLGRLPSEGETFTARDGSFSISCDQLVLVNADQETILNQCPGELIASRELEWRYQGLKDVVRAYAERVYGDKGKKRVLDEDHEDGPPRKQRC
ncbi:hypothetical protein B0T16DRAFT_507578 [Cercophora newfieldiana]|uniref:Uncharacterized protein n=1 Tax=Cercophora newfieldiana TaxID=92897 RepID=A0AA40CSH4_9PEZI|nr:hypothetical protein B0T16DRAFT_507578 [Cercophora newfieldiana]